MKKDSIVRLILCAVILLFSVQLFAQKAALAEGVYAHINSLYNAKDYPSCVRMESEVLASIANRKDTLAASLYSLLGDSFLNEGNQDKAVHYFEDELNLRREIGQSRTADFSNALYNLTVVYGERGEYAKAKKTGKELLALDGLLKGLQSEDYASSLLFVLETLEKSGDYIEAKEVGEEGLRVIGDKNVYYPMLLSKVADVYSSLGLYGKAELAFRKAISLLIASEGENSLNTINTVTNLATLYSNQGRYPEAEELFTVVIDYLKKSNDENAKKSFASTLNNFALVQQALAQYSEAEVSLKEVLASDKETYGTNHPYYATSLVNLGKLYFDMGQMNDAEATLKQAIEILKAKEENRFVYAATVNNLANIYRMQHEGTEAIPLYEEARKIFLEKAGQKSAEYATATFNLGLSYYQTNNPLAKNYLEDALNIRTQLFGKRHPKYGETTRKIASYWWQQNDYTKTLNFYNETFKNYFEQIDAYFSALSEDEKSKFYLGKLKPTFEEYYTFAVQRSAKKAELLNSFYDYQLRTKAMIMYATQKVRNAILQSNDSILIKQFNQWLEQKELLAKMYSQGAGTSEEVQKKIDSLTAATNKSEKSLTEKSATFTQTYKQKNVTWKDVKRALKPNEAAVEIIRYREYSPADGGKFTGKIQYAFLIVSAKTKNNPQLVLINDARLLESRYLNFYRNSIMYKSDDSISYNQFWKPLVPILKGYKKIYVSADGVYNQINLSTLKNPATNRYVFDDYNIEVVSNTKELVKEKIYTSKKKKATLIGYPKYTDNLNQQPKENGEVQRGLSRGLNRGVSRSLRNSILRGNENGIPELPGTKEEIEKIKNLFANDSAQTITQTQATESFIKSLKSPAMLHIATHGFFLEDVTVDKDEGNHYVDNPMLRSGLIMAGAGDFLLSGETQTEDGILSAYEVMNLNLDNTGLVVLSACETGLGAVRNGEGVYGLQRAFQIAGAKSIVMSLWQVDDDATKELMINFYQELLKTNNIHEAFRLAQEKLKEHFKEPFYWGAFVMVGD